MSRLARIAWWVAVSFGALLMLFAIASSRLASSPEPLYVIESDIEIEAPAAEVWRVLTNFARYPEWNPYAIRIEADVRLADGRSFRVGYGETLRIGRSDPPGRLHNGAYEIRGVPLHELTP